MAWEASRPVPWQRLCKEWAIYASLMAVLFGLFFRDRGMLGILIGLVASLPLYLGLGAVLAKLGYQRKTLREGRAAARAVRESPSSARAPVPSRPKPAPTKRTGGGAPAKRRR